LILLFILLLLFAAPAWAVDTETFTGTDPDLGTKWDPYVDVCQRASDEGAITNGGVRCFEGFNNTIPAANQYAQIVLGSFWGDTSGSGSATQDVGVFVRLAAPTTLQGYTCRANFGEATTSLIRRYDSSVSFSTLTSEASTTWAVGDVLRCEVSGSTITLYRNGVSLLSWSDGTYASGRTGISIFGDNSAPSVDNFEMGDLAASASRIPHRAIVIQ